MRDWLKAFRPARFRGVPFKVDIEGAAGARRLSVAPIAYSDESVIEDFGSNLRAFDLAAYVAGDVADVEAQALIAALDAKGPAMLILPMLGPEMVRITSWRVSRRLRLAGYVGFDISVLRAGLSAVPFSTQAGVGAISDLVVVAGALLGSVFAAQTSSMDLGEQNAEIEAANDAQQRFASALPLIAAGEDLDSEITSASATLDDVAADPIRFPARFALGLNDAWRKAALHGDADAVFDLALRTVANAGRTVVGRCEASAIISAGAIAAIRQDHLSRQDARRSREQMRDSAALVLADIGDVLGHEVFEAMANVTGEAAVSLSRIAADRAPINLIETGISLSSIRLAYDLYQDASRASELVSRNRISTPAIMPVRFEALAT